ncbi:MAG: hypothetical protein ACTHLW_14630 [Verrucomicrobiota bacterium]
MKLKQLPKITLATWAIASGLFLAQAARSQDLTYAGFDTDTQGASYAWGIDSSYLTAEWDGTVDSKTNAASGSLKCSVAWPASASYQEVNQSLDIAVADLSLYDKFSFDVKVDPASSPAADGNYGTTRVALRGPSYSWNGWLGEPTITPDATNGWFHYEYSIPASIPSLVQLNLGFGGTYTGPVTYWVDNLTFIAKAEPTLPPTLAIAKSGPGLEIMTCGGGDYSRKNIATKNDLAPVLSWVNSANAVTYSMTINQSVAGDGAGADSDHSFAANIMLVAGSDLTINASPDWDQPHGIFMEAKPNLNGTVDVTVRYKTNAPSSHGIRNDDAGLLISKTNTGVNSLVGTWALTLSNTTVTVTGPGGITGSAELFADVPALFGNPNMFFALFGAQPNTHKDRNISLSRVHIYGGLDFNGTVDQDFTTAETLDPNLEIKEEGSAGGVVLKPTNTTWRISWALPDSGLYLWSSLTLNPLDWAYTELTPVTQGSLRAAFTTNVTSSARFFQLRNSGPATPPFLLESFESTSPFPAATAPYFNFEPSTTAGVTDGTYSLHVSYTNDSTWAWSGSTDYGAAAYDAWKTHSKLVFDLHRAAFTDGWNLELVAAIDGTMGWNQSQLVNWVWLNAGESTSETITWDYSSLLGAAPATGTSWILNFMLRGSAGDINGHSGDVYIDNIRFEN